MPALRWAAFAVMAAFAGFAGMTVVGYTVTDLGGWEPVDPIALAAVPTALLCLLAWWQPAVALPVLAAARLAPVVFGVMQRVDYARWSAWEDAQGPVSLVLVVTVAAALAVLGVSRPAEAGLMMVAVVLVPVLVSGSLFLLAGREGAGRHPASRPSQLAR